MPRTGEALSSRSMPAKRRAVDSLDQERWQRLRDESASRHRELLDAGPTDDPLDSLAWKAGSLPDPQFSFDNDLRERIERARESRYTWREIASALGEGEDDEAAQRVADRQKWRNRAHRRALSGES